MPNQVLLSKTEDGRKHPCGCQDKHNLTGKHAALEFSFYCTCDKDRFDLPEHNYFSHSFYKHPIFFHSIKISCVLKLINHVQNNSSILSRQVRVSRLIKVDVTYQYAFPRRVLPEGHSNVDEDDSVADHEDRDVLGGCPVNLILQRSLCRSGGGARRSQGLFS